MQMIDLDCCWLVFEMSLVCICDLSNTTGYEQGVFNHLLQRIVLGFHETILSFGDWIPSTCRRARFIPGVSTNSYA